MTEQPELFELEPIRSIPCPFKGCRRKARGPIRHGLSNHYVCTGTPPHESIERQGPR